MRAVGSRPRASARERFPLLLNNGGTENAEKLTLESRYSRITLLTASLNAHGQDARPSSLRRTGRIGKTEGEEIVVTATRLPIAEEKSPASVSVVTSRDIEQRQVQRVADALREVPGSASPNRRARVS
jgi:outer membrane receptor for ferric coprogen and ferric-rhodotorulic acid